MSGFGLEHEEQVAIFLRLFVIWKGSFQDLGRIIEVAGHFILLGLQSDESRGMGPTKAYLFQGHPIRNQQGNSRIQVSHIFLQHKVLLGLTGDPCFQVAQRPLCPGQVITDF